MKTKQQPKTEADAERELARTLIGMIRSDAFVGMVWNFALVKAMRLDADLSPPDGTSDLNLFIDAEARAFGDKLAERIQAFGVISPAGMEHARQMSRELGRPLETVRYWTKPPTHGPKIGPNGVIKDDDEAFGQVHLKHVFRDALS